MHAPGPTDKSSCASIFGSFSKISAVSSGDFLQREFLLKRHDRRYGFECILSSAEVLREHLFLEEQRASKWACVDDLDYFEMGLQRNVNASKWICG